MLAGTPKGDHELDIDVKSKKWQKTVTSTVPVNVVYLNDTVVTSSASLRLAGVFQLQLNSLHMFICMCFIGTGQQTWHVYQGRQQRLKMWTHNRWGAAFYTNE